MVVREIDINKIKVVENVRMSKNDSSIKALMHSITQNGLKEPIGITKDNVLIYGWRRLTACKKLGWTSIPAVISEDDTEASVMISNMVENVQRRNVTPVELGRLCIKLTKLKLTPGEVAARLDLPPSQVKRAMMLYKFLPDSLKDKIAFFGAGNEHNAGEMSSHSAHKIIQSGSTAGLTKKQINELLEYARVNKLTGDRMDLATAIIANGVPIKKAIKEINKYQLVRVDLAVIKKDFEEKKAEFKMHYVNELIPAILYGEATPLRRPPFLVKKNK